MPPSNRCKVAFHGGETLKAFQPSLRLPAKPKAYVRLNHAIPDQVCPVHVSIDYLSPDHVTPDCVYSRYPLSCHTRPRRTCGLTQSTLQEPTGEMSSKSLSSKSSSSSSSPSSSSLSIESRGSILPPLGPLLPHPPNGPPAPPR